jgi:EKC/KEOPS complex subunit CGI121/TPRKB
MALYSARYAHHPAHLAAVHIAFLTDVKNAAEIRASIVKAATLEGAEGNAAKDAVNFAFVDSRLVRPGASSSSGLHSN